MATGSCGKTRFYVKIAFSKTGSYIGFNYIRNEKNTICGNGHKLRSRGGVVSM